MIQSRARCRLVCSVPAYCVKFLTTTLRTVWVTRQESKAYLCVLYATRHLVLYFGICGVKYYIYKAFIIFIQTDISNYLGDIISLSANRFVVLTLPAGAITLAYNFDRSVCPESDTKRLPPITLANSLKTDQTRPKVCSCLVMFLK